MQKLYLLISFVLLLLSTERLFAQCSITRTSAAGTNAQTVCINNSITAITYDTAGTATVNVTGLPAGVTGTWAAKTLTISGTPTQPGTFKYMINFTGGCIATKDSGTITVTANNTVALSSAVGTDAQSLCINNAITNITYNTTGATGATVAGLPAGVTWVWAADVVTISGTPAVAGSFPYTITLTGGCGTVTAAGTITVTANNTVNLSSAVGTDAQTVCITNAITTITYNTTVATGATVAGLPAGVTGVWAADVVTISGTPTVAGSFPYTVTLTGGCGNVTATGTITVTADNTITLSSGAGSNNQTLCISTVMTNITFNTTVATGATVTGLPAGVAGVWAADVVTISGTPTVAGSFPYTVTLTGGCGTATSTGTISVTPGNTITLSSGAGTNNQTLCSSALMTNITFNTTGAAGATVAGLPTGVTGVWAANVVTISGTPTAAGTFPYTVTLAGGCGTVTANGTLTVNPLPTATVTLTSNLLCAYTNDTAIFQGFNGTPPYTFYYKINGGTTQSQTTTIGDTLQIPFVTPGSGTVNYSLVLVTDLNGCSQTQTGSATVTASAQPLVNAVTNSNYCNGDLITKNFTSNTAGVTFNWTSNIDIGFDTAGTGNINATAINLLTYPQTATIHITASVNGCTGPVTYFYIKVNPTPDVKYVPNYNYCTGNSDNIVFQSFTPGVTFHWTNSNTTIGIAAAGTGSIPAFIATNNTGNYTNTGQFSVYATTNNGGCDGPAKTFEIRVTKSPAVSLNNTDTVFCNGKSDTIYFTTNPANATIKWLGSADIGFSTSGTVSGVSAIKKIGFTAFNPGTDTLFDLISAVPYVVGDSCFGDTLKFVLVVYPTAKSVQVINQTYCNNDIVPAIIFSDTLTESESISWFQIDSVPDFIGSYFSGKDSIPSFTAVNTTTDTIIATYSYAGIINGCKGTSLLFKITVYPTPALATYSLPQSTFCNGEQMPAINFNSATQGDVVISWTCDNYIGFNTSGTEFIPATKAINNTDTIIVATINYSSTINGCQGSGSSFTITVNPTPAIASYSLPKSTFCNGDSIPGVNFNSATVGDTIKWTCSTDIGFGTSGNDSISTALALNNTTTTIVATIIYQGSINGCTGLDSAFTITVYPTPAVATFSLLDSTFCNGETIPTIKFSSSTIGDFIYWTCTPDIGFGTSGNDSIPTVATINNTDSTVVATITYYGLIDICPGLPSSFTITVYPTPAIASYSLPKSTFCNGDSIPGVNFNSATVGDTIKWTCSTDIGFGTSGNDTIPTALALNNTTTTIVATIIYQGSINGCTGSDSSFTITVYPTPAIATFSLLDSTFCNGETIPTIKFNSTTDGDTLYWTSTLDIGFGTIGKDSISATMASNNTNATIVATITYWGSINGCKGPDSVFTITVYPTPLVVNLNDFTYCNKDTIPVQTFNSNVTGTSATHHYSWSFNNNIGITPLTGKDSIPQGIATNTIIFNPVPILATITVSDSLNGCMGPDTTFKITVNPSPRLSNSIAFPFKICDGVPLNFVAQSNLANSTFTWTRNGTGLTPAFNSGLNSVVIDTLNNLTDSAVHAVYNFTITSLANCKANDYDTIKVNPTPKVNSIAPLVFCNGETIDTIPLSSNISDPALTHHYHWSYLGGNMGITNPGADSTSTYAIQSGTAIYNITNPTPTLIAINDEVSGCKGPDSILNVTVLKSPEKPSIQWYPKNTGNPIELCSGSNNISFFVDTSSYTYSWSSTDSNNVDIKNVNGPNTVISFLNADTNTIYAQAQYTLNNKTCYNKDSVTVIVSDSSDSFLERKIFIKQPGNLLVYPDNSMSSYQWGYDTVYNYDSLSFGPPNIIILQVYQYLIPYNKFILNNALDTAHYYFWVLLNNGGCYSKVYYNGPYANKPIAVTPASNDIKLNVFPNPSNGVIEVALQGDIYGSIDAKVYNSLGQIVFQKGFIKNVHQVTQQFDLDKLPNGLYSLELNSSDMQKVNTRIIIQHQ